jgi:hypothetical protein
MAYHITGLNPAAFADTDALIAAGAIRVTADQPNAFPCRITLEDAGPGENLLLLNHVSANVSTPFRASHAIYIREGATEAAAYIDAVPPFIARRTISLRAFDQAGMIRAATLAQIGEADAQIRRILEDEEIVHVDIHAAAWGCFLARAERHDA